MDILAATLAQAAFPESGPQPEAAEEGFAEALVLAQGGQAPPGPEPPPGANTRVEEEAVSLKPNAQPQTPDSPPTAEVAIDLVPIFASEDQPGTEPASEPQAAPSEDVATLVALLGGGAFQPDLSPKAATDKAVTTVAAQPQGDVAKAVDCIAGPKVSQRVSKPKERFILPKPKVESGIPLDPTSRPAVETPPVAGATPTSVKVAEAVPQVATATQQPVETQAEVASQLREMGGMVVSVETEDVPVEIRVASTASQPVDAMLGKKRMIDGRSVEPAARRHAPTVAATPVAPIDLIEEIPETAPLLISEEVPATTQAVAASTPQKPKEVEPVAASIAQPATLEEALPEPPAETDVLETVDPTTLRTDAPTTLRVERTETNVVADRPLRTEETAQVIRQVIDRLETLAATKPRDGITIHLEPKDFGNITMVVKAMGSEVDARIYASNDQVRHALEQNRSQLGVAMEQRGYQLTSVNVASQAQMTAGGDHRHTSRQHDQQTPQQGQTYHSGRFEGGHTPVLSMAQIRMASKKAAGVDLWI